MKRWCSASFIVIYLCALTWGIVSHTLNYRVGAHPSMYFLVWDMFCGWASHSLRIQVVGEGESGRYYELAPGPWGDFEPYGHIGRRHYDIYLLFSGRQGINTLKHTRHEPMRRIYLIEECWPKKYNLPDHVYERRHDEPKDAHHYYHKAVVMDGEGNILQKKANWYSHQASKSVFDNPRLQADTRKGQPFYQLSLQTDRSRTGNARAGTLNQAFERIGSRLGGSSAD